MEQKQYEQYEVGQFLKQLREVEELPLCERKENAEAFRQALLDAPLIAECVNWLIQGSYGYGSYIKALEIISRPRMNQSAWLGITIAALEWGCPSSMARKAFKSLPPENQKQIREAIEIEILEYLMENKAST